MNKKSYDIIIVGAGTAGMSAAIYGVRSGKSVLIIEEKIYGGQIINTPEVENYPSIDSISGAAFATNLYNQAVGLGTEYINEQVTGINKSEYDKSLEVVSSDKNKPLTKRIFTVDTDNNSYEAKAVIIATGSKHRTLGIEKEYKLLGKGVSYCATCDGMFFRNRDVAVVGGGNTALEDALFLAEYCHRVYIIHRRDKFRGEKTIESALHEKENVHFLMDSIVDEIYGDDVLNGISVLNVKNSSRQKVEVNGLFVAIGRIPDNEKFSNIVNLDKYGYVVAGEDCKTNCAGVFVAGDCRTKNIRQLTTAAADGAVAALGACAYIDTTL
jgi:thioredoxin reductase (NADPH)